MKPLGLNVLRDVVLIEGLDEDLPPAIKLTGKDRSPLVGPPHPSAGILELGAQELGRHLIFFVSEAMEVHVFEEESNHGILDHRADEGVHDRSEPPLPPDPLEVR